MDCLPASSEDHHLGKLDVKAPSTSLEQPVSLGGAGGHHRLMEVEDPKVDSSRCGASNTNWRANLSYESGG